MATNAKKGLNSAERGDNGDSRNQQENNDPQVLETFGQDIDVVTSARGLFGYSKLHAAASSGQARLLKLFLSDDSKVHSKDVNGKTVDGGYTPLHLAASAGHKECVEELLNCHKTDMHVTDAFGRTPLETAEQNFKHDVALLLRSHEVKAISKSDSVDANLLIAYESAMREGSESSNQFKLVTLGAEGAGKTSSINTLLNLPFQSNQESTVGASVNSCTVDMHLTNSKWKEVTATFQIMKISKQYNKEIIAAVSSVPVKPAGATKPISQKVIDEVNKIHASKEEMPKDGNIRIVIFDIGGQEVYYDVHFLFLAPEDVALLVFDCSKGLDDPVISRHRTGRFGEKIATRGMLSNIKTIELLMHSVYSRGQKAPEGSVSHRLPVVIMLGAHAENLLDEEKEMIIQTIYQRFDGKPFLEHLPCLKKEAFHFLANSNPNPKSVEHLRLTVLKAAKIVITSKRPISYLKFESKILEKIQQAEVRLSRADAVDIARDVGVEGEKAVDALLQYFTSKGILLYYPGVNSLKNDIFISPQKVSDLVCAVITTHDCQPTTAKLQQSYRRYNQYALLEETLLNFILLQSNTSKDKQILLGLLDMFNLATEVPANTKFSHENGSPKSGASKVFIVPSLLVYDNKVPYHKQEGDIVVQYYFPDEFLPESIFNQLLVKTIQWCCKHNHMIR